MRVPGEEFHVCLAGRLANELRSAPYPRLPSAVEYQGRCRGGGKHGVGMTGMIKRYCMLIYSGISAMLFKPFGHQAFLDSAPDLIITS